MSLWKYSFEIVIRELGLTRKKKQALDELFAAKKISQSTYAYLESDLSDAITDLDDHLRALMEKMTARAQELEKQIGTLELFLANLELYHAAEEVDDQTYERQNRAILLGLEATNQELRDIKDSLCRVTTEQSRMQPESEPQEVESEKERVEKTASAVSAGEKESCGEENTEATAKASVELEAVALPSTSQDSAM